MQQIRNLIFDLGNVIIPIEEQHYWWKSIFLKTFSDEEKVWKLKENGFFTEFEKGHYTAEQFMQTLKPLIKDGFEEKDIWTNWNKILHEIPKHRLDALKKLKKKYHLLLLSNTNEIHLSTIRQNLIRRFGQDELRIIFDHCYYSFEMGMVKPEEEIYRKVLTSEQINPSETLFLDDSLENLKGAEKLGIQTIHVMPHEDFSVKYNF